MELTSAPKTIELNLRELEVGVQGDIRYFMLYDRDTLKFGDDGIIVRMVAKDGTTVLEESTLRWDHIQWHTIRYRKLVQAVPGPPTQSVDPEGPAMPAGTSVGGQS